MKDLFNIMASFKCNTMQWQNKILYHTNLQNPFKTNILSQTHNATRLLFLFSHFSVM